MCITRHRAVGSGLSSTSRESLRDIAASHVRRAARAPMPNGRIGKIRGKTLGWRRRCRPPDERPAAQVCEAIGHDAMRRQPHDAPNIRAPQSGAAAPSALPWRRPAGARSAAARRTRSCRASSSRTAIGMPEARPAARRPPIRMRNAGDCSPHAPSRRRRSRNSPQPRQPQPKPKPKPKVAAAKPKDDAGADGDGLGQGPRQHPHRVLVNGEPITAYEIEQRARLMALRSDIQARAQAQDEAAGHLRSRQRALEADRRRRRSSANQGKTREQIMAIIQEKQKAYSMGLQKQAIEGARAAAITSPMRDKAREGADRGADQAAGRQAQRRLARRGHGRGPVKDIAQRNKMTSAGVRARTSPAWASTS